LQLLEAVPGPEGGDGVELPAALDHLLGDRQDIARVLRDELLQLGQPFGDPGPLVEQLTRLEQRADRDRCDATGVLGGAGHRDVEGVAHRVVALEIQVGAGGDQDPRL
jgi:hypothetical protein